MHDLASAQDCTPDPSYDAAVCGFHNFDGCIPINGCGSTAAYYYLSSFTLLVSFVLFNIFIAIVLEGFANEKDRANGVLLRQHVRPTIAWIRSPSRIHETVRSC